MDKLIKLVKDEQGQGMTEYGLLLAVVVVAVVGFVGVFREQLTALFTKVTEALTNAVNGAIGG